MAPSQQIPLLGVALTEIDDAASFYAEGQHQLCCAKCESVGPFEVHHVIQGQRCRREGAPRHSPDNALRLCAKSATACHERHTTHQELVPLRCLRDENIAFAVRHLGPGPAYVYFTTYYAGADERLDQLAT